MCVDVRVCPRSVWNTSVCVWNVEFAANSAYVRLYPNRLEWNDPIIGCSPTLNTIPSALCPCCNFLLIYKDRINVVHFDQPFSNVVSAPGCFENCCWFGVCGICCSPRNVYVGANPPIDCFECCCGCVRICCKKYCGCPGKLCSCCETTVLRGTTVHSVSVFHQFLPFALLPALKDPALFIAAYNNAHAKFRAQFPMVEVTMVR